MGSTLTYRAPGISIPVSGTATFCTVPHDGGGNEAYIYADVNGALCWSEFKPSSSQVFGGAPAKESFKKPTVKRK